MTPASSSPAARVPVCVVEWQEATVPVDAEFDDCEAVVVECMQRLRPSLTADVSTPRQAS